VPSSPNRFFDPRVRRNGAEPDLADGHRPPAAFRIRGNLL